VSLFSQGDIGSKATADTTYHALVSEACSDANNNGGGVSSSSDASGAHTPIVSSSKVDSGTLISSMPRTSSPMVSLKQIPKKKTLKPIKTLLAQRSGATNSAGVPPKRFASAHTRSYAGNAQLLTGVEVSSSNTRKEGPRTGASSLVKSVIKCGTIHQKDSKGGVAGTRNGAPVSKIVLNTGILYIFTKTHRAEFVRTK
jgi:hypothetical protein